MIKWVANILLLGGTSLIIFASADFISLSGLLFRAIGDTIYIQQSIMAKDWALVVLMAAFFALDTSGLVIGLLP